VASATSTQPEIPVVTPVARAIVPGQQQRLAATSRQQHSIILPQQPGQQGRLARSAPYKPASGR
jgi:hypothetical protein